MSAAYQIGADSVSDAVACACACGCYAPTLPGRLCVACSYSACPGPSPWVWTPADLGIAPRNGFETAMLGGDWWVADRCTALALVERITRAARRVGLKAELRTPPPTFRTVLAIRRRRRDDD